jgi:hypothetical protein
MACVDGEPPTRLAEAFGPFRARAVRVDDGAFLMLAPHQVWLAGRARHTVAEAIEPNPQASISDANDAGE